MDLISFLIALVMLVCSTASPSQYNSRAKLCPDRSMCNCAIIENVYEIECPAVDPSIIVKVEPTKFVQIECLTFDESVYKQLATLEIGEIPRVQFVRCLLPMGGTSLMTILNRLGVRKTRSLMFLTHGAELGSSLVRQHLSGFTHLQQLRLSGSGLTELPEDLFNDVGNLTWLDLRSNRVHLSVNIFRSLKKLEYLELGYNNLDALEPGLFKPQQSLKNLNLWGNNLQHLKKETFEGLSSLLELDISSNNIETLQPGVFSYLTNLTALNLSGNKFRKLPDGLFDNNKNLVRLRLIENRVDLDTLPNGFLSGLSKLEEVNVKCGLNSVSGDLFSGSLNIKNLSLAWNDLVSLPVSLLANQSKILELDLSGNGIRELEDGFFDSISELLVLTLSHNNLTMISGILFHGLHSVREIHLDNNQLQTIHHLAFTTTSKVHNLQLQNNRLSFANEDEIGSQEVQIGSPFQFIEELQILNLRNNEIISILSDWTIINVNLKELDLSYNRISSLSFEGLQFSSEGATINLTNNAIRDIDFRDYRQIMGQNVTKTATVLLNNNPLTCACRMFHFIEYIQLRVRQPIQIEVDQLKCASPERMSEKSVTELQLIDIVCPLDPPNSSIKHCPLECECFVRPFDRVMVVNCSNSNLRFVPSIPDITGRGLAFAELYIENNNITELPDLSRAAYFYVNVIRAKNNSIKIIKRDNLPPKLRLLDISKNQINWLNATVFDRLNGTSELQHIEMAQNPWICDCDAKGLLAFAKSNAAKIKDIKSVVCLDGQPLVYVDGICSENETIIVTLSVVLTLLGVAGILAALYYKYEKEFKVWMYAHYWCSWFVAEEEHDQKDYDAFIWYLPKDEEFIVKDLMPGLENGRPRFKVCSREDWLAGDFIPSAIERSVANSRRTIVILSPNIVETLKTDETAVTDETAGTNKTVRTDETDWFMATFKTAHGKAMKEGRARLILVTYKDIDNIEDLKDPDLKSYLKTSTYIRLNDPWFWKKLRYAMPHPNGNESKDKLAGGKCTNR